MAPPREGDSLCCVTVALFAILAVGLATPFSKLPISSVAELPQHPFGRARVFHSVWASAFVPDVSPNSATGCDAAHRRSLRRLPILKALSMPSDRMPKGAQRPHQIPMPPMSVSQRTPRAATVAAANSEPQSQLNVMQLSNVVLETMKVHELVEEFRGDLAKVNAGMREDVDDSLLRSIETDTLQKSVAVEAKVNTVSDKVATVTDELVEHAQDRRLLLFKFAAVVKQEAAARHAADQLLVSAAALMRAADSAMYQAKRGESGYAFAI